MWHLSLIIDHTLPLMFLFSCCRYIIEIDCFTISQRILKITLRNLTLIFTDYLLLMDRMLSFMTLMFIIVVIITIKFSEKCFVI